MGGARHHPPHLGNTELSAMHSIVWSDLCGINARIEAAVMSPGRKVG
jgi:hypothetical protein